MKILSQPKFKPFECEACKARIQIEAGDKIEAKRFMGTSYIFKLFATCPICGYNLNQLEFNEADESPETVNKR